ncbi:uncharacterized protein [Rutidosis leptorrhynchoides]|uniref:uncharacterized protein isoform X2 n=1 Tax=Rutidosis leptorrhynchoides TaxID=125765 RepID=UPI003A98E0A1
MTSTNGQIVSITPETKEILHQSILHYLHRNGFSKTFKRFQSESHIKDDTWKASTANLEDIYCKYVNARCQDEDNVVVETETKEKKKKKKKNKLELASGDENKETNSDLSKKPVSDTTNELEVKESEKKPKDKKRKSKEQDVCTKENGNVNPDVANEEKKSSKKRKRLVSDESERQSAKIETNQTVDESDALVTSDKDLNEKSEMDGKKTGSQKSGKKQRIESAEPKTVNAFQRVKIDQVEFAHEKLQDNSYWAKDGADIGYGAKAQEVLGQVRGRDFRHEKTKKKRGSYRGGQIDLQSHSIKFDYSDQE